MNKSQVIISLFPLYFVIEFLKHVSIAGLDLILIKHLLVIRVLNSGSPAIVHDVIVDVTLGVL